MKLPEDTLISVDKLTQYLLAFKKRNDKLQWLSKAGYAIDNWQTLEKDLREQIFTIDATPTEKTKYCQMFEISGELLGPNGMSLSVITIWMTENENKITKFITMYPNKRRM